MNLSDLPESKIESALDSMGLINGVVVDGEIVDNFKVQIAHYDDTDVGLDEDERMLSIMVNGENNTGLSAQHMDLNCTIYIGGLKNSADMIVTRMVAESFMSALRDSDYYDRCGVFEFIPSGVFGPVMSNERPVYTLTTRVLLNR